MQAASSHFLQRFSPWSNKKGCDTLLQPTLRSGYSSTVTKASFIVKCAAGHPTLKSLLSYATSYTAFKKKHSLLHITTGCVTLHVNSPWQVIPVLPFVLTKNTSLSRNLSQHFLKLFYPMLPLNTFRVCFRWAPTAAEVPVVRRGGTGCVSQGRNTRGNAGFPRSTAPPKQHSSDPHFFWTRVLAECWRNSQ